MMELQLIILLLTGTIMQCSSPPSATSAQAKAFSAGESKGLPNGFALSLATPAHDVTISSFVLETRIEQLLIRSSARLVTS